MNCHGNHDRNNNGNMNEKGNKRRMSHMFMMLICCGAPVILLLIIPLLRNSGLRAGANGFLSVLAMLTNDDEST